MTDKTDIQTTQAERAPRRDQDDALMPLVDIYETEDGTTVLTAEVPGADPDSLDIRVDKGVLSLSAEPAEPELGEQYARTYVGFVGGPYHRAFALSDDIDREKIEASMDNGVLTVRLPKAEAAQTKRIPIK